MFRYGGDMMLNFIIEILLLVLKILLNGFLLYGEMIVPPYDMSYTEMRVVHHTAEIIGG